MAAGSPAAFSRPSHLSPPVTRLADALRGERGLLASLRLVLLRQRAAIEAARAQELADCTYAAQRILLTLGAARQRRHAIATMLGLPAALTAPELVNALEPDVPDDLRAAARDVETMARELTDEINRSREALARAITAAE